MFRAIAPLCKLCFGDISYLDGRWFLKAKSRWAGEIQVGIEYPPDARGAQAPVKIYQVYCAQGEFIHGGNNITPYFRTNFDPATSFTEGGLG